MANNYRLNGETPIQAVMNGAKRRFRPILLTSLTTFLGLAPMILEKSLQARFLIPMAISLGLGLICNWDYSVDRSITVYDREDLKGFLLEYSTSTSNRNDTTLEFVW